MKTILNKLLHKAIFSTIDTSKYDFFKDVKMTDNNGLFINDLAEQGALKAYTGSKFEPCKKITIGEFINIFLLAMDYKKFADANNNIFIDKACEIKILNTSDFSTKEAYNTVLTRIKMAEICYNILSLVLKEKINCILKHRIAASIIDNDDLVATGLQDIIYTLYEAGILTGCSNGKFSPDTYVKRGDACAAIYRLLHKTFRKSVKFSRKKGEPTFFIGTQPDDMDYSINIHLNEPLENQYKMAIDFLKEEVSLELSDKVINNAISYAKTKTNAKYNLSKKWFLDGEEVTTDCYDHRNKFLEVDSEAKELTIRLNIYNED